jgi:hypothetical protein
MTLSQFFEERALQLLNNKALQGMYLTSGEESINEKFQ